VGDAAHSIHPLAGQGANLGYSDVRVLLEELSHSKSARLSPADATVLARYQRRRKGENLSMMAAMEGFKQLFGRDELPVRWLRNTGLRWFNRLGPIKHSIAARAMGLNR
jgi:2-octaprenylphenol hydroxylase